MTDNPLTETQRKANALLVEHFERQVSAARTYTTAITGIGYAGALTFWNGSRDYLGHGAVLATGALLSASLIVFVAFELAKSWSQMLSGRAFEETVAQHYWSEEFQTRVTEANARVIRRVECVNSWQPSAFWFTSATGVGAALWLAVDIAAKALKLWQAC